MIHEQLLSLAIPIGSIQMDPNNARLRTPKNLDAIKASLTKFGQRKAIVVNKTTGHIEAGNGTYQAAREMGWEKIAAIFVEDGDKEAKAYAIADNRTSELAEWDDDVLLSQLEELGEVDDLLSQLEELGEVDDLGFDEDDFLKLEKAVNPDGKTVAEAIFPEYDESIVKDVQYHECPKCNHKWPK